MCQCFIQSPISCPNNILMTSRCPWFRPKGGKRIGWVRLFGSRRNLSLVMIGLVCKAVVGPKCLHGFLTNGWKQWLAAQPGRLHPLNLLLLYWRPEFSLSSTTLFQTFSLAPDQLRARLHNYQELPQNPKYIECGSVTHILLPHSIFIKPRYLWFRIFLTNRPFCRLFWVDSGWWR